MGMDRAVAPSSSQGMNTKLNYVLASTKQTHFANPVFIPEMETAVTIKRTFTASKQPKAHFCPSDFGKRRRTEIFPNAVVTFYFASEPNA